MTELVVPKITVEEDTDTYLRIVAEPLEPGFGTTVGNALRRVLLSSLRGAAITAVRIEQVQHEFAAVPNMREDVIEFLLNVKEIRLRALADRPGRLYLDVAGEMRVTAGDIQTPPDYEIVNPELYLATLDSEDARLKVEFYVESGRGWHQAGYGDGLPIGVIPVDAIFTPVRKVNYTVERSRVGQVTNYDRLILDIWTNGTISGMEAMHQAADILVQQFTLFRQLGQPAAVTGERRLGFGVNLDPERYNTPIEALDLSVRAYNCLKRSGLKTVGQVLEMSEEELLSLRNFGRKSYDELKESLINLGFLPPSSAEVEPSLPLGSTAEREDEAEAGVATRASSAEDRPWREPAAGRAPTIESEEQEEAAEELEEEAEGELAEEEEEIDPRLRQLLRLRRQLEE